MSNTPTENKLLETLLGPLPRAICLIDSQQKHRCVSTTCWQVLGYESSEPMGKFFVGTGIPSIALLYGRSILTTSFGPLNASSSAASTSGRQMSMTF